MKGPRRNVSCAAGVSADIGIDVNDEGRSSQGDSGYSAGLFIQVSHF